MAKKENTQGFTETGKDFEESAENTTLMKVDHADIAGVDMIEQLKNPDSLFFCSIPDDGTRKSKIAIYNAVNSQDEQLADHINEVLEITDVVAHPVVLTDETTGEKIESLRVVLVDKSNKKYGAVSQGIISSLQKIFAIVGFPTWKEEPLKVKVRQVQTRNGANKVNTIELVD